MTEPLKLLAAAFVGGFVWSALGLAVALWMAAARGGGDGD